MPLPNADDYRSSLYDLACSVLEEIGAREPCSENERRLGRRLADEWRALGLDVRTETFTCHPKAFLGFIPTASFAMLFFARSSRQPSVKRVVTPSSTPYWSPPGSQPRNAVTPRSRSGSGVHCSPSDVVSCGSSDDT